MDKDVEVDEFHDALGDEEEEQKEEETKASSGEIVYTEREPKERKVLPWFKDPSVKLGAWAIIKDNIGKDISKITVPVFFNDPTSLLQKSAQSMEYNHILDNCAKLKDIPKRLAYMAVYCASVATIAERNVSKPFNPLLGETFEYETDDFLFLSE